MFVESDGIHVIEEQVASVNDVLFGDANDEVRTGVAGIGFDERCQSAQVEFHRKLRRIQWAIGKPQNGGIDSAKNVTHGNDQFRGMFTRDFTLGVFYAGFERT